MFISTVTTIEAYGSSNLLSSASNWSWVGVYVPSD